MTQETICLEAAELLEVFQWSAEDIRLRRRMEVRKKIQS